MAEKKKTTKKTAVSDDTATRKKAYSRLKKLNDALNAGIPTKGKKDEKDSESGHVYERQIQESDPFSAFYSSNQLAIPPYDFTRLYNIYEESDTLQACVEAMKQNVDGFGYTLDFMGDDLKERDKSDIQKEHQTLSDFFDRVNEAQSFTSLRKLFREDYEVLGIGGFEAIRNRKGQLNLMYHAPFRNIRMSKKLTEPVAVDYKIKRGGEIVPITIKRRFRRFAQISDTTNQKIRWFKQFGDPRTMNYETGKFEKTKGKEATEILAIKHPFGGLPYGMPRWICCVLEAMGRRSASFVNYDMFNNQGIPPILISLIGGSLTDESVDSLRDMILGLRGVQEWNKVSVIEIEPEAVGLDDRGKADLKIHDLAGIRKEDLMFGEYRKTAANDIRQRYRLPPVYSGGTSDYTYASARVSQTVAEEQIFIPERFEFDEDIDISIIWNEFGIHKWKYHSRGPQIVGSKEISSGIGAFTRAGALSVNNAIDLINRSFGMSVSKRHEKWADLPVVLLTKWVEKGGQLPEFGNIGTIPDDSSGNPPAPVSEEEEKTKILKTIEELGKLLEDIPEKNPENIS